ncbi:MAG: hypothetical protein V4723_07265 [Pseudomonadota bacterium]
MIVLLALNASAHGADFSGKRYYLGRHPIAVGSLLECHRLPLLHLDTESPKIYAWARRAGLIETSAISGTLGFTDKVSSQDGSERSLLVGCWIATKIITEKVNGQERAYAQGVYQINDALKASPVMDLGVCRKKRNDPSFGQGDVELLTETGGDRCVTDSWNERVPSLRALQGHVQLFAARKLRDRPGYIREVGW